MQSAVDMDKIVSSNRSLDGTINSPSFLERFPNPYKKRLQLDVKFATSSPVKKCEKKLEIRLNI